MMEQQMGDHSRDTNDPTPRRGFFGRIAALAALGASGLSPTLVRSEEVSGSDGPDWPGVLKARHRQVFDVYSINGGSPLGFANNFLTPNESATAVLVFRHSGTPYALGSAMWEKYKVGESFQIIDPETKASAVKNPWLEPKPGVLNNREAALDRLFARGTVMGVCSISLRAQARRLAGNAGVSAEEALKEWTANLIPGVTVIPSGTWGVNRAQEAGCTYCAGG
jgi:hypothetical protein